ncbi:MAG: hypothetical protein E7191_00010 [Erysipelotrichaceae bacterium]|nr:hypothetical protein [Erysipelotrichaceae bacterium]MBR3694263.1 hypothetical protein [Erysipelotrichales bacterium]
MDRIWRKFGLPVCIIIIGTVMYRVVGSFGFAFKSVVMELIKAFTFFSFGMALNTYKKKRSSAWIGKLIISFVMFFYVFYSLGYITGFGNLVNVLNMLGLLHSVMAIPLVYILCGFLFFD